MPSKINAYATFIQFNAMLLGAGNAVSTTAPVAPDARPLPALTLTATATALTLTAAAAYDPASIIYAARPLLPGANDYPDSAFKRIGSLPALALGANDISSMYLDVFNIRTAGFEIALKIVGVMDSGFYTPGRLVTAVVSG